MDVDIDTRSDFDPLKHFPMAIRASIYRDKKLIPHNCGVYFQQVPQDPQTKLSAIPYEMAEDLGAFKVDFLHLAVYDHFQSREEIEVLCRTEPDWGLLKIASVVSQLFQISKHFDLISEVAPMSVIELADALALIRPQKRFMLDLYKRDREKARQMLYVQEPGSGYAFKKAHAVAYALVIVLQLHLIKIGVSFAR